MHITFEHDEKCPTRSDQWARGEYEYQSITAGQGVCPFCEMRKVEHEGDIDFSELAKKIRSRKEDE
jgi:hypothetical protein